MQFLVKMVPWMCYTQIMTFYLFFIFGLDILDSFDCLGRKIDHFIQDMNPAVWSNSEKLP